MTLSVGSHKSCFNKEAEMAWMIESSAISQPVLLFVYF